MSLADWRYRQIAKTTIFLIAGQSNAVGRGDSYDAGLDTTDARILQLGQAGQLALATEPLSHVDPIEGKIGFGLSFARAYIAAHGGTVILVPCAQGSTGFAGNAWNPGNVRYGTAISRTNYVLAATGGRFGGVLWQQGEADANAALTEAQYAAAFDSMVAGMRSSIVAPAFPFFVGGMSPEWYAGNATREGIQAAIEDAPNRLDDCIYVSSAGLTGNLAGDEIHIDAASQRILGPRYFDAVAAYEAL